MVRELSEITKTPFRTQNKKGSYQHYYDMAHAIRVWYKGCDNVTDCWSKKEFNHVPTKEWDVSFGYVEGFNSSNAPSYWKYVSRYIFPFKNIYKKDWSHSKNLCWSYILFMCLIKFNFKKEDKSKPIWINPQSIIKVTQIINIVILTEKIYLS